MESDANVNAMFQERLELPNEALEDQKPLDILKEIMGEIRKAIPVGFTHHRPDSKEYKEKAL